MVISIHFWLLCFCPLTAPFGVSKQWHLRLFLSSPFPYCVADMTLAIPSGAGGESCVAGLALVECSGSVAANVWDGMCLLGGRRGRNVRFEQQGSATNILRRESACSRRVLPRRFCILRFGREGPSAGISKPG